MGESGTEKGSKRVGGDGQGRAAVFRDVIASGCLD